MQIWVDADACPGPVKEILYRAAQRVQVATTFVANQFLQVPASPHIKSLQVPGGFDVADNEIVERVQVGDLVVTADIPLASAVIDRGATALNPRGELYTAESIRERLSMRDFLDTLRGSGIQSGGPAPLDSRDRARFANTLDRWLQGNRAT